MIVISVSFLVNLLAFGMRCDIFQKMINPTIHLFFVKPVFILKLTKDELLIDKVHFKVIIRI